MKKENEKSASLRLKFMPIYGAAAGVVGPPFMRTSFPDSPSRNKHILYMLVFPMDWTYAAGSSPLFLLVV